MYYFIFFLPFFKFFFSGKILQGVEKKRILQDIRSTSKSTERKHYITKKDHQNIKRDFGLCLPSKGNIIDNDEQSVYSWVESMKQTNVILYYFTKDKVRNTLG